MVGFGGLLFYNNHSNGCEVIFHWHFNLRFPVISNVEHLYMCLLAVCIFSLEKCLLKSFVHILIKLFCFLLLNCRSSLYILDSNPLSAIWVANIVFYLFTLLICVLWCTEGFSFNVIQFFYFYFSHLCFRCYIHKVIAKSKAMKLFSCVFFWEF